MKPLRVFVVHLTMLPYVLGTVLKSASITVSRFYVLASHWLVILVFWSIHTKLLWNILQHTLARMAAEQSSSQVQPVVACSQTAEDFYCDC